jgi:hypothetical protein
MSAFRSRFRAIAVVALMLGGLGCGDSTGTTALGKVSARVVDANGAGVFGVEADLYKVGGGASILWRASLTSSNGVAVFGANDGGVVTGDYFIRLTFTNGYELATGETNDRPVTVNEGDDLVVTFHSLPKGPGGP